MDLRLETNCDDVAKLLKQLPTDLRNKYGVRGLESAAQIVVMAVTNLVPVATGLLRQSIGATRVKFYSTSGTLFTSIEPLKGFKRIVTATASGQTRIRGRRTTSVNATFGRVQNPRQYMHIIESGRDPVMAPPGGILHSALDPQNRFFSHAKGVGPHPVFGPAAQSVEGAVRVAVEIELEKGIEEFNQREVASAA